MNQTKPTILLNEALELMESKKPFSVVFRKCDTNRRIGGELAEFNNVILHGSDWPNATRTVKPADDAQGDNLKAFHIRLMVYFNDRRVIW